MSAYYTYLAQNPTISRIDFMLETTRRIDRTIASTKLTPTTRTALLKNKKKLNKQIVMEAQSIRSKKVPSIEGKPFDTTKEYSKLSIQERPLSCEISATSDVVSTILQDTVTEDMLVPLLPKQHYGLARDPYGIWGNPESGFVGDIYGSQRKITGFGVYEGPISEIYSHYGISTVLPTETANVKKRLTEILEALQSGKRVQLWGDWCTDPAAEDGTSADVTMGEIRALDISATNVCSSWNKDRTIEWSYLGPNLEKIEVKAWNGEHAFVLLGFYGTAEAPTNIIVWDTYTGRHVYPTSEWLRKWSKVDNRALIIETKAVKTTEK